MMRMIHYIVSWGCVNYEISAFLSMAPYVRGEFKKL